MITIIIKAIRFEKKSKKSKPKAKKKPTSPGAGTFKHFGTGSRSSHLISIEKNKRPLSLDHLFNHLKLLLFFLSSYSFSIGFIVFSLFFFFEIYLFIFLLGSGAIIVVRESRARRRKIKSCLMKSQEVHPLESTATIVAM